MKTQLGICGLHRLLLYGKVQLGHSSKFLLLFSIYEKVIQVLKEKKVSKLI